MIAAVAIITIAITRIVIDGNSGISSSGRTVASGGLLSVAAVLFISEYPFEPSAYQYILQSKG